MARCLIGCGSNLGKPREQLDRALELLRYMPGIELLAVSRYRETAPVGGPPAQGRYVNGACLIETELPPRDLLGMLFAVENTLHRRREDRWGPRTVDLDLLLYGDLVVESPDLTLPHPRMATRRFVLEPCAEIAAELPYPPADCTVRDLLDNISVPHPLVVVVGVPGSGASEVAAAVADATLGRLIHAAVPLPHGIPAEGDLAAWREALAAWRRPLVADDWHDDPHGTIADYWLDGLREAAGERLPADARESFEAEFDHAADAAVAPHVAIFLTLSAESLAERVAFRQRPGGRHTNLFADLACVDTTDAAAAEVASLVRLQERLARRLRCPAERCPRAPKAVIRIPADDLAAAAADAMAAVEAML